MGENFRIGLVWSGWGRGDLEGLRRRQEDAWVRDQEPGARQARDTLVSGSLGFSEGAGWDGGVVGENRGLRSEADDQSLWLGKRRITLAFTNTAHTST